MQTISIQKINNSHRPIWIECHRDAVVFRLKFGIVLFFYSCYLRRGKTFSSWKQRKMRNANFIWHTKCELAFRIQSNRWETEKRDQTKSISKLVKIENVAVEQHISVLLFDLIHISSVWFPPCAHICQLFQNGNRFLNRSISVAIVHAFGSIKHKN